MGSPKFVFPTYHVSVTTNGRTLDSFPGTVGPKDALLAVDFLDLIPDCSGSILLGVRRCPNSELVSQPRIGDKHVVEGVQAVSNPDNCKRQKDW